MKHQVVMDVSEFEEVQAVQFEKGKKKGWEECIKRLQELVSKQTPTQVHNIVATSNNDQLLSIAEILANPDKQQRPSIVHRRTRGPNKTSIESPSANV